MSDQERAAREAELWRQIVDNFGERASLDEEPATVASRPQRIEDDADPEPDEQEPWEDEGRFVPPDPVPGPLPEPRRMLAWIGVIGVPLIAIVLAFTDWSLPTPIPLLLFVWCVGGFGYLIATMSHDDDGWDDGARV